MSQVVNTKGAERVTTPKPATAGVKMVASSAPRMASLSLPPQSVNTETAVNTPLNPKRPRLALLGSAER